MLHKNSQLTGSDVPAFFRNHKDIVFWTFDLSTHGLSNLKTWKERALYLRRFLESLPDQKFVHKPAHYLIRWAVMSDGESMWVIFPTRQGWSDFIWYDSKPFMVKGQEVYQISYYDLAQIFHDENNANPMRFAPILLLLQQLKETGIMPDPATINAYSTITGNSLEHLFHAAAIGFVEQINKNQHGLGMEMSYSLYPITPQRAQEAIQMPKGKLTLYWTLHEAVTHHMELPKFMDMVETRWQRTSKDKKKERYYTIDGYWPDKNQPAYLDYTRTKEFVFALTPNYSKILLEIARCAQGGLHFLIREEFNNQSALEAWAQCNIIPDAINFDGECAWFDDGYVRFLGNGKAVVCLYQDWSEKMIVDAMKYKRNITKHRPEKVSKKKHTQSNNVATDTIPTSD